MDNEARAAITLFFVVLWAISCAISCGEGRNWGKEDIQKEAARVKVGRYTSDESGNPKFTWNTPNKIDYTHPPAEDY